VTKKIQAFFCGAALQLSKSLATPRRDQPLSVPPLSPEQKVEAELVLQAYRDVQQEGNVTLDEASRIEAMEKKAVPITTLTDMKEVLGGFHVFLHVLFDVEVQDGTEDPAAPVHPLIVEWDRFWEHVNEDDRLWDDEIRRNPGRAFHVVRWVHLRTANWGELQQSTDMYKPPPPYERIWEGVIQQDDSWVPVFDPTHMAYGSVPKKALTAAREPGSAGGGNAYGGSKSETNHNPRPGDKREREPGVHIKNPKPHPDYAGIDLKKKPIGKAIDEGWKQNPRDPPPISLHSPPLPYCLSWHLKGSCHDNCGKRADHIVHEERDHQELKAWAKRRWDF
jgi:hypothetical protein